MRLPIVILLCVLASLVHAGVQQEVLENTQACNANAQLDQQRYCMIKHTPRKCRDYVRDPKMVMSFSLRQSWLKCIATCEGADLWSRTFGPCSTPSDIRK